MFFRRLMREHAPRLLSVNYHFLMHWPEELRRYGSPLNVSTLGRQNNIFDLISIEKKNPRSAKIWCLLPFFPGYERAYGTLKNLNISMRHATSHAELLQVARLLDFPPPSAVSHPLRCLSMRNLVFWNRMIFLLVLSPSKHGSADFCSKMSEWKPEFSTEPLLSKKPKQQPIAAGNLVFFFFSSPLARSLAHDLNLVSIFLKLIIFFFWKIPQCWRSSGEVDDSC